ncbi:MAG: hypothetical protein KGO96_07965 [Elusimicrobia bacterium]|nr:hypothetical protein [Elusimicrobiota bacterium]MDE2236536.1 hypothetical protein [Elusimicrobiota bacterium]MDE2425826.1 hypothetical protein [Elusimicrobiota bacterium]
MTARWVDRLERPLRFLEIPDLAAFLAGMNVLCAVLTYVKPEFPAQLLLEPSLVLRGQIWRMLTFVLVPPDLSALLLFFWLLLYFSYLSGLERSWGSFRLTLYVLLGALTIAAASTAVGVALGSGMFVTSLFLAFARESPEVRILLFFVIPVKIRWIGAVVWACIAWILLFGGYVDRLAVVSGLVNYALFYGGEHAFELKQAWRRRRYR